MKILFCVHRFYPEIGGIQTVTDLLCRELLRAGWQVEVAAANPAPSGQDALLPYLVLRAPSMSTLRRRMQAADCVVMQHLSIRHLLPLWLSRARSLTVLHMGIEIWSAKGALYGVLFHLHVRLVRHTAAVSNALRRHVPGVKMTLPNPYDDALFFTDPGAPPAPRQRLAYVGRVVSVKGVEFAVEALRLLRARGRDCHLTIIGDGPSLPEMRALVRRLDLESWVVFCGEKPAAELPALLRELGTLLVPSNYFEAFGLVVVEAMACGMDVVAFRRGGLPEAVGDAGLLSDENTAEGLAAKVEQLLDDPALQAHLHAARAPHLACFHRAAAAARYREAIAGIVTSRESLGRRRRKTSSKC